MNGVRYNLAELAGVTVSKIVQNDLYEISFCKNYVKCCEVNQGFCTNGAAVKKERDGSCDALLGLWNNENSAVSESLCTCQHFFDFFEFCICIGL